MPAANDDPGREAMGLPLVVRDCFDGLLSHHGLDAQTAERLIADSIETGMPREDATVEKASVHKSLVCCGLDPDERIYRLLFEYILPHLEAAVGSGGMPWDKKVHFLCAAQIGLESGADRTLRYHGQVITETWVVADFLMTMFIHVSTGRPNSAPQPRSANLRSKCWRATDTSPGSPRATCRPSGSPGTTACRWRLTEPHSGPPRCGWLTRHFSRASRTSTRRRTRRIPRCLLAAQLSRIKSIRVISEVSRAGQKNI